MQTAVLFLIKILNVTQKQPANPEERPPACGTAYSGLRKIEGIEGKAARLRHSCRARLQS